MFHPPTHLSAFNPVITNPMGLGADVHPGRTWEHSSKGVLERAEGRLMGVFSGVGKVLEKGKEEVETVVEGVETFGKNTVHAVETFGKNTVHAVGSGLMTAFKWTEYALLGVGGVVLTVGLWKGLETAGEVYAGVSGKRRRLA